MKPAAFEYVRPQSLGEAVGLMDQKEGAKVIAGGQSLVPLMNFRLNRPQVLVDLGGVGGLNAVRWESGKIVTGALVRHQELVENSLIREHLPVLGRAAREIGHWAIRNRGTVGGSLAHADPAAELVAALVALSGTVVAQSARGTRRIPAEEFLLGYFTTSLAANEVITAVDWEIPAGRVGFFEVVRRPGDFAVLGAFVGLGADPHVTWFGAGGRARRFPLADWAGSEASRRSRLVELAGQLDLEPHEEYKRTMAVDVAMRAAKDAEGDDN